MNDTNIIKLFKVGDKETLWYNSQPVDTLEASDIKSILQKKIGSSSSYVNTKQSILLVKNILKKELREKNNPNLKVLDENDFSSLKSETCICPLCRNGLPTFLKSIESLPDSYQDLSYYISVSMYSIIQLIKTIIPDEQYQKMKEVEKEKLNFVKNKLLYYYMCIHNSQLKITPTLFNLKTSFKYDFRQTITNCLFNQPDIFKSGKNVFNTTGYWTLSNKNYHPWTEGLNKLIGLLENGSKQTSILERIKENNNNNNNNNNDDDDDDDDNDDGVYAQENDNSSSDSEQNFKNGKSRFCGAIGLNGKPCEHNGRCHHHFEIKDRINKKRNSTHHSSTPTTSTISLTPTLRTRSKRNLDVNENNTNTTDDDEQQLNKKKRIIISKGPTTTTKTSSPTKILNVNEWERKILYKFNFYPIINSMDSDYKDYNISKEFSRFFSLKIVYDRDNSKRLVPSNLIEKFWVKFVLDTSNYRNFFKVMEIDFIDYNPNDDDDDNITIEERSKRYQNTLELYKRHFNSIDDEIWN